MKKLSILLVCGLGLLGNVYAGADASSECPCCQPVCGCGPEYGCSDEGCVAHKPQSESFEPKQEGAGQSSAAPHSEACYTSGK